MSNTASEGGGISNAYAIQTSDYNDVWNNKPTNYEGFYPGEHDISADPLLVDPANGDFHLTSNSPCIDAGDPDNYPPIDFEGNIRPMGLAPDIGIYEYRTLWVRKTATLDEIPPGTPLTYTMELGNPLDFTLTDVLLTDILPVETAFVDYQSNDLSCTHDGSIWGGRLICTLDNPHLYPGERRSIALNLIITDTLATAKYVTNAVTLTASAGGDTFIATSRARTWTSDCAIQLNDIPMGNNIQEAIDASTQASDVVKVSGYCRVNGLNLTKTLILQGGWNPEFNWRDTVEYPTTLDGQGLRRVLTVGGDASPTIEGFTITGGYDYNGGGILNASGNAIIQNNLFTGNTAYGEYGGGGGFANDSGNPTIQNNLFIGNRADSQGGGITVYDGNPIIRNNIVYSNSASDTGGLFLLAGNPIVLNNTITSNSECGITILNDSPVILSNIIANNQGADVGGIYSTECSTPTLNYNNVWNSPGENYIGVDPGPHDISADPMLVDPAHGDFHLAPGSPCIDTGDPVNYPATDFEGDPRPIGAAPDIGADEFMGPLAFSWRLIAWRASSRSIRLPQMLIPLVQVFWSARGRRANS